MSTIVIVLICIIVVAILAAFAWWAVTKRRRDHLRERFGPEYDRVVANKDSTREAERELNARAERHEKLDIRPLNPANRERFQAEWRTAQERFVDDPPLALAKADVLVQDAMHERGYPLGSFDQRAADLSVEHADVLDHYRAAHQVEMDTERGHASTEDMRRAMVHYRALFASLLDDRGDNERSDHESRSPA